MNTFTVQGKLVRKFVSNTGKMASITLELPAQGKQFGPKVSVKTFDTALVTIVGRIPEGATVTVTCRIEVECTRDKAGQDVSVDGFKLWSPSLVALTITNPGSAPDNAPDTSKVPF